MFTKYEIRNVLGEDILYLFFNQHYEFSNEFDSDLSLYSEQFIQMNHIPFHGHKIYYVVDGVVVKKSNYKHPFFYDPDHFILHIQLEDQSMIEVLLKEYLLSILFSYYRPELGDEVFKSICILFNTYAYKKMDEDGFINNDFHSYIPSSDYQKQYNHYYDLVRRFSSIIDSVSCLFLAYDKEYILPFIHYCNGGKTVVNKKYPYLSSVKSLWDLASPDYLDIEDYDYETLSNLFQVKLESTSSVRVINQGHAIKMKYKTFSIHEIKDLLHLRSNDISIIINQDGLRFITKGIGNALGLSIYGSSCIEKNGGNVYSILNYYYPKCTIYKNIKELS